MSSFPAPQGAERASVSGSSRRPPAPPLAPPGRRVRSWTARPSVLILLPGAARGGAKISRFPYQRCTERCRRVPTSLCGSEPNHRLTRS